MIPWLTEARIHEHTDSRSYERGMNYHASGDVLSIVQHGHTLQAVVKGSSYTPYSILIQFDETRFAAYSCSCPYGAGGFCKHLAAVLLTCLHTPEAVEERPVLEELLDTLDADSLKQLIMTLIQKRPEWFDEVERVATRLAIPDSDRRPVWHDAAFVKSRVLGILHSLYEMRPSQAYWQVGTLFNDLYKELEAVTDFLDMHEPDNALNQLQGLTEAFMEEWMYLEGAEDDTGIFFSELGTAWVEVLLSVELYEDQRASWRDTLQA